MKPKRAWQKVAIAILLSVLVLVLAYETIKSYLLLGIEYALGYLSALIGALVLFKGKFVWSVFLRNVALTGAKELSKRYVIEEVLTKPFKDHFVAPLKRELAEVFRYLKRGFYRIPFSKKIVAAVTALGTLGIVVRFVGIVLAIKVAIARFWSMVLRGILWIFRKFGVLKRLLWRFCLRIIGVAYVCKEAKKAITFVKWRLLRQLRRASFKSAHYLQKILYRWRILHARPGHKRVLLKRSLRPSFFVVLHSRRQNKKPIKQSGFERMRTKRCGGGEARSYRCRQGRKFFQNQIPLRQIRGVNQRGKNQARAVSLPYRRGVS